MDSFGDRKSDRRLTTGVKSKWIKAFRSLKLGTNSDRNENNERKFDKESSKFHAFDGQHAFQENTYKKITACDVCREILRGHSRQGLKCKLCKMNVHCGQCQDNAPKCQPKPRLLRKQKSASELETKIILPAIEDEKEEKSTSSEPQFVDPVYQSLKQAAEARRNPTFELPLDCDNSSSQTTPPNMDKYSGTPYVRSKSTASSSCSSPSYLLAVKAPLHAYSAPHSPQRKKLTLRMKSLSLDSPESTEHALKRNLQVQPHSLQHHNKSSYNQSPQSPILQRKLFFGKHNKMNSVDLPDMNERSSASPSPCPSPKPQRLLPTNIFVVLYNFRGRNYDELDLKAGYTVTVIDTSDPDWWQGKIFGRKGFFPSTYVTKLFPGEKPLQVCHTIQVNDGDVGVKLLRDQIVIQVVDEVDGIIMIRTGINDKIVPCPTKYLQEI